MPQHKNIEIVFHKDYGGMCNNIFHCYSDPPYEPTELGKKLLSLGMTPEELDRIAYHDELRDDPRLVSAVREVEDEELAVAVGSWDSQWTINEYDGLESVLFVSLPDHFASLIIHLGEKGLCETASTMTRLLKSFMELFPSAGKME